MDLNRSPVRRSYALHFDQDRPLRRDHECVRVRRLGGVQQCDAGNLVVTDTFTQIGLELPFASAARRPYPNHNHADDASWRPPGLVHSRPVTPLAAIPASWVAAPVIPQFGRDERGAEPMRMASGSSSAAVTPDGARHRRRRDPGQSRHLAALAWLCQRGQPRDKIDEVGCFRSLPHSVNSAWADSHLGLWRHRSGARRVLGDHHQRHVLAERDDRR